MSLKCVIPGCNSTEYTRRLFSFQIDWLEKIEFLDLNQTNIKNTFICVDHFSPEEIIASSDFPNQLLPGAVPSNFNCIRDVPENSCRFCLKTILNPTDKVLIDNTTKKYFKDLTSLEVILLKLPKFQCVLKDL